MSPSTISAARARQDAWELNSWQLLQRGSEGVCIFLQLSTILLLQHRQSLNGNLKLLFHTIHATLRHQTMVCLPLVISSRLANLWHLPPSVISYRKQMRRCYLMRSLQAYLRMVYRLAIMALGQM